MIQKTEHKAMQRIQRGFSLVSAIFLLVVIAALGTFAVTLSTAQHQSAALDVMGSRAYQASRAGIEWAAFQITQSSVPVVGSGVAAACQSGSAPPQPTLPAGTQLSAFSVNVACSAVPYVDGTSGWIYQVSSVAATQGLAAGNPGYVERQMTAKIVQ